MICTSYSKGRRHDFGLFKRSKVHIQTDTKVITDSGYQGIAKLHSKAVLPKKRKKNKPLSKEDKQYNQELARQRVRK